MARARTVTALIVASTLGLWSCDKPVAQQLSADALADDESAIYLSFLSRWAGKDKSPLNVSDKAEALSSEDIGKFTECAGGDGQWVAATNPSVFTRSFSALRYVRLVDEKKWSPADPGEIISKGTEVDSAVKRGMSGGLLILSAIRFDKGHRVAALKYSFVCGALCGAGGVVIFERKKGVWAKSKKRCGGWVS